MKKGLLKKEIIVVSLSAVENQRVLEARHFDCAQCDICAVNLTF
jgi:hypothetical protein